MYDQQIKDLLSDPEGNLMKIVQLDYRVTALEYEKEFIRQSEGAYLNLMKNAIEGSITNLYTAQHISMGSSVASYTTTDEMWEFVLGFSTFPPGSRNQAFNDIFTAIENSLQKSENIQNQIQQLLGPITSKIATRVTAWQAAKAGARFGSSIAQKIQHLMTRYNISDDDVLKNIRADKISNPLLRAALEAVASGFTDQQDVSVSGFYSSVASSINLSQVGLAITDTQRQQENMKEFIRGVHEKVYGNWNGDMAKLREKAQDFISECKLEGIKDAVERTIDINALDFTDILDKDKRGQALKDMRNRLRAIIQEMQVQRPEIFKVQQGNI